MFDLSQAKQILNEENQNSYSDEEVKLITELLFRWAQLTVDTYYEGDDQNS
jgi:predicted membrane-bound spermidine synthase